MDFRFEVELIMIEGLNHAVNFGIEFFRQQEVSISHTVKEVKLVTGSEGQERLTRLSSAYGNPFPFMINPIPAGGGVNLTPPCSFFLHNSKSIGLMLLKFSDFSYIPKALPLGLKPGFNMCQYFHNSSIFQIQPLT